MASASSQARGLAESQDQQTLDATDYLDYEDPARSWIDLVAACHSGDPRRVRELLVVAKQSHWTHQEFDEALKVAELEEDPDYGGLKVKCSNTQCHDTGHCNCLMAASARGEFYEE